MSNLNKFLAFAAQRQDLVFALFFVLIIAMLVLPMPLFMIDTLIAVNLTLALIILVTATYLKHALDLSTFPSIILVTTIFRVSLSVSTTRLILGYGDAGDIIRGFGNFVIGGNIVVGIVVFLIIAIVQFMVVTKGAERISEVSARFTLDAMPGKQMSIDNDLRSGDIDKTEARRRRQTLEKESQFHGAMDGAMRFVKGDAIASLIIVFVNMIGGLIIGMLQRGLSLGEAGHLYTLLSVGDGLVAQIPAMLIAVAAGTIVTRISTDESKDLGSDIGRQLVSDPRVMGVAAAIAVGMGLIPGFPTVIFFILAAALAGACYMLVKRQKAAQGLDETVPLAETADDDLVEESMDEAELPIAKPTSAIVVELSEERLKQFSTQSCKLALDKNYEKFNKKYGVELFFGFNINKKIDNNSFIIRIMQVDALKGDFSAVKNNTNGNLVEFNYLLENINSEIVANIDSLFGVSQAIAWVQANEESLGRLANDVQQSVPPLVFVEVLRKLISDDVGLYPAHLVLEGVLIGASRSQDPEVIADFVRMKLRRQICNNVAGPDGVIRAFVVAPELDDAIRRSAQPNRDVPAMRMDEATIKRFVESVRQSFDGGQVEEVKPVLLCSPESRRAIRKLLVQNGLRIPVLAYPDITQEFQIKTQGVVSSEAPLAA